MKKAQKFTLELDDDTPELDDVAFLFFHTSIPNYVFVDDMNRLFWLALARQADLNMNGLPWPLFRHHDPMTKLTYLVVERPAGSGGSAPHWVEGHKLMIIQGEVAGMRAEQLRDDFSTPPHLNPYSTLADEERAQILADYQRELVPVSLFTPGDNIDTPLSRKAAKERAELELLVYDLMDCLDINRI